MKVTLGIVILASAALAQPGRPHGPATYGSRSGFGNVVYPGTGRPPIGPYPNPAGIIYPGFSAALGATVAGHPYTGGHGGRGAGYVPYVYPMYGGVVNPYGYGYGQGMMSPVVVIQQPQQPVMAAPQPQIVINNYADPNVRAYEPITTYQAPARKPVESGPDPSYYLIAFKDNTIYSAVAYWVDGDTLHYVTSGNVRNQVSLTLIDNELTERLNRDRNVEVKLK